MLRRGFCRLRAIPVTVAMCIAVTLLVWGSSAPEDPVWRGRVGVGNPLCAWLCIASVEAALASRILETGMRSRTNALSVRFAGWLAVIISTALALTTLLHVWPMPETADPWLALLGLPLLIAGLILLRERWFGPDPDGASRVPATYR